MATLTNGSIASVPAAPDVDFPELDPITTFDLVGPGAANRQPDVLKTRDDTLRGRVNLLITNMNDISTGDPNDSLIMFVPRDGTNPLSADWDIGAHAIILNTVGNTLSGDAAKVEFKSATLINITAAAGPVTVTATGGASFTINDAGGGSDIDVVGNIDMQSAQKMVNLVAGTAAADAIRKDQALLLDGTQAMAAALVMGSNKITGLTDGTADTDAATYRQTLGLKLKLEFAAFDPHLSAVTVGEEGCDFTDIKDALDYVNNITRSAQRQVAIYVFEKQDANAGYEIAVEWTVPTYTHLIGMGKPVIFHDNGGLTGAFISLDEGATIQNFLVEDRIGDMPYGIRFTGNRSEAKNVDVRNEVNSSQNTYAFYAEGTACRIQDCRVLPWSGNPLMGCYGIYGGGANFVVLNCVMEVTARGLYTDGNGGQYSNNQVICTASSDYGVYVGGSLSNVSNLSVLSALVMSGGVVYFVSCYITDLEVVASVASLGLVASGGIVGGCKISNFYLESCRCEILAGSQLANGFIDYNAADANAALLVKGDQCVMTALKIDRGGASQPCISAVDADECMVTGCILDNVGGPATAIENPSAGTSTDWLCSGNMVARATGLGNGWDIVGEKVI